MNRIIKYFLVILLCSCDTLFVLHDVQMYVISEGNHYPDKRPYRIIDLKGNKRLKRGKYTWMIPSSSHHHQDEERDWHKLGGWSPGSNHHDNSERLGWRPNLSGDGYEVCRYIYYKGKRSFWKIMDCQYGDRYELDFEIHNHRLSIIPELQDTARVIFRPLPIQLNPYFGGTNVAPKDIVIYYNIEGR